MSNQLILDSLQRRMKALFSLYDDAIDSMTLEHVNHFEREGVVPIAFCLFHYANVHDASFMMLSGQTPLWNDEWQARVGLSINDHGKHRTVDEMVHQRIGDLDQFCGKFFADLHHGFPRLPWRYSQAGFGSSRL